LTLVPPLRYVSPRRQGRTIALSASSSPRVPPASEERRGPRSLHPVQHPAPVERALQAVSPLSSRSPTRPSRLGRPTLDEHSADLVTTCVFSHILNCLVQNEPGVLSRVSGILAARGFNIGASDRSRHAHPRPSSLIPTFTSLRLSCRMLDRDPRSFSYVHRPQRTGRCG
jgi:hypothetical protein